MALGPRAISGDRGVYLYVPYSPIFVDQLKDAIPPALRDWQGDRGCWYIFESCAEKAVRIARINWPHLDITYYTSPNSQSDSTRQRKPEGWEWNATNTKKRWVDARGDFGPWVDARAGQWQSRDPNLSDFARDYFRRETQSNYTGSEDPDDQGSDTWRRAQRAERDRAERESRARAEAEARQRASWGRGSGSQQSRPQAPVVLEDHALLYVLPNAPPDVIKAAYKALAGLYHPDKGSASDRDLRTRKMQDLNAAYDRLKKAGKA